MVTASNWSGSLLGMLIAVLIARRLGPAAVGSLGFGTGLVGLVMAALLPGFSQAHLKRLADGQDPGRCLGTMAAVQASLAAGLVPLVIVTSHLGVLSRLGGFGHEAEVDAVSVLLLASQVASRFADVYLSVFLVREWVVHHAAIVTGARLLRLGATLAVLAWAPRVSLVAAAFAIEGVASALAAASVLGLRHGIRMQAPTRESLRGYWTYARPFLVTTPIALFQDSIDRVVVGGWAGLTAAGHYHVARALWEALAGVMAAPGLFLFTRLSALYARGSGAVAEARAFFLSGLDKLLFLSVPLAFLFWVFAEWLIHALYGAAFAPAAPALRILVLATVAANVVNPYTFVLYAREEVARFIPVNLLRAVVYLVALGLLVPAGPLVGPVSGLGTGATGAAVCRLFLILFPAWVYFRWTREVAEIGLDGRVWRYLVAFAVSVALEQGLGPVLAAAGAPPLVNALLLALIGLAVYLAILWRIHPNTAENLGYARSLASPEKLWSFLRGAARAGSDG